VRRLPDEDRNRRLGGGSLQHSAQPLDLDFTPEGRLTIQEARDWLTKISAPTAQRFATALNQELRKLTKACAVNPPTQPHEQASLYYARPVFCQRFKTGKATIKRSASGVWYVYYDLTDTNRDGRPERLRTLLVLHAARQAPWEKTSEDEEESE
jgi:hypothetical protein